MAVSIMVLQFMNGELKPIIKKNLTNFLGSKV